MPAVVVVAPGNVQAGNQDQFKQLIDTNSCPSCDLSGLVLTRLDLSGADLEGADLSEAKLFLTDLSDANLKRANLKGAKLGGADFANADLRGADLTGAVVEGAYLESALMGELPGPAPEEVVESEQVSQEPAAVEEQPTHVQQSDEPVEKVEDADQAELTPEENQDLEVSAIALEPMVDAEPGGKVLHPDEEVVHGKKLVTIEDVVIEEELPGTQSVEDESHKVDDGVSDILVGKKEDRVVTETMDSLEQPLPSESVGEVVPSSVEEKEVVIATPVVEPEKVGMAIATDDQILLPPKEDVKSAKAIIPLEDAVIEEETSLSQSTENKENTGVDVEVNTLAKQTPVVPAEVETTTMGAVTESMEAENPLEEEIIVVEGGAAETAAAPETSAKGDATVMAVKGEEVAADWENDESVVPVAVNPEEVLRPSMSEESLIVEGLTGGEIEASVPKGAETVSGMIEAMDESSGVQPTSPEKVYTVPTPQEADVERQQIVDRLLDMESCVECNLRGVDLSGKNLSEFDLERADLSESNLEGADLSEANLKGVDFRSANLRQADLSEADLYRADFSGADLTGADLGKTLVESTTFDGAIGVNLEGAVIVE